MPTLTEVAQPVMLSVVPLVIAPPPVVVTPIVAPPTAAPVQSLIQTVMPQVGAAHPQQPGEKPIVPIQLGQSDVRNHQRAEEQTTQIKTPAATVVLCGYQL